MNKCIIFLIIFVSAFWLYIPYSSIACGPFFEEMVFTYPNNPEMPVDSYYKGNLGIILPDYARIYLFAAYRYMMGIDFDDDVILSLSNFSNNRMFLWQGEGTEWLEMWFNARSKVPGVGEHPEIATYGSIDGKWYIEYLNINEHAIYNATKTLNDRISKFGADNPQVLEWVKAQDMVFSNSLKSSSIPQPADPSVDPVFIADRNYQIASANFYAGNFDEAERLFRNIANDPSSQWNKIANYLVARTIIRKATIKSEPSTIDFENLTKAENELKKILSNDALSELHQSARGLLGFVQFRLYPDERLNQIGHELLVKDSKDDMVMLLKDYLPLLDKIALDKYEDDRWQKAFAELGDIIDAYGEDNLTEWILVFQADNNYALDYALRKWEEKHSLPWLVASISKIDANHPKAKEIVNASQSISQDSPAYATIAFHRIRLLIDSDQINEARKELESILSKKSIPQSSRNLFLAQRMKIADSLDEFLKYAIRNPVGVQYQGMQMPAESDYGEKFKEFQAQKLLDADSAKIINEKMPLSLLNEIAKKETLPNDIRKEASIAVWVKAILLNDEKISIDIIPTLSGLVPELSKYLESYRLAKDAGERQFIAVYTILKFPGMLPYVGSVLPRLTPLGTIDSYRDNWWGIFAKDKEPDSDLGYYSARTRISSPLDILYPKGKMDFPYFVSQKQIDDTNREWVDFAKLELAPNYLSAIVIKWAEGHLNDPNVPEALHLAVKSTRYGITDEKTSSFSKKAFQILHKQYPKSEWATKTKYWY